MTKIFTERYINALCGYIVLSILFVTVLSSTSHTETFIPHTTALCEDKGDELESFDDLLARTAFMPSNPVDTNPTIKPLLNIVEMGIVQARIFGSLGGIFEDEHGRIILKHKHDVMNIEYSLHRSEYGREIISMNIPMSYDNLIIEEWPDYFSDEIVCSGGPGASLRFEVRTLEHKPDVYAFIFMQAGAGVRYSIDIIGGVKRDELCSDQFYFGDYYRY